MRGNRTCVDCHKSISRDATRCRSCANKYKGKTKSAQRVPNLCPDCKKKMSRGAKRCRSCASKAAHARGCYDHVWEAMRLPQNYCVDCGEPIKRRPTRCRSCATKYNWARPEYRKKVVEAIRSTWTDERREERSQLMSEVSSRPETRRKKSVNTKAAWKRGVFDTERWKKLHSKASKAAWARGCFANRDTKEYRERQSKVKKEAWARGDMDGVFRNNRPSKLERDMASALNSLGIKYEQEYRIDGAPYYFDFHLPRWGALLEIDGEFYHHSEWAKEHSNPRRDAEKDKLAAEHGYPLLRIRGASMRRHGAETIAESILCLLDKEAMV